MRLSCAGPKYALRPRSKFKLVIRMRLLLLCFLLFGLNLVMAQNGPDKLETKFTFQDCDGFDETGNGSSGALIGGTSCVCGVRDSAMSLDGDGDALFFVGPLGDVFTTSDFTVSFYMKPHLASMQGGSQVVMSKQENCNNNRAFWVRYSQQTNKIASAISQSDSLVTTVQASLDPDKCWQYITLTRNNTRYALYVNGILRDSASANVRINLTSNSVLKVGDPVCQLDRGYNGDFDELEIYSKALSATEVMDLYLRPDMILTNDTLIYLGNSFQVLTNPSCAQNYLWSPTTGVSDPSSPTPVITPIEPTTYKLTTLHNGCNAAFDTIRVNVIDPDTLDCNKIFIPNAFTPGASSGRNDLFRVSNPYAIDEFISFEVFDRWGGRMFNGTSAFDAWDGTFGGKYVNPGVFLYRLRYKCEGEDKVKAGNLTLLR